jgi:hypothetical protein
MPSCWTICAGAPNRRVTTARPPPHPIAPTTRKATERGDARAVAYRRVAVGGLGCVGFLLLQLCRRPNFVARAASRLRSSRGRLAADRPRAVAVRIGAAFAARARRAVDGHARAVRRGMLVRRSRRCVLRRGRRARWRRSAARDFRVRLPGLVFLTGIGWLLLLDLSANGPR